MKRILWACLLASLQFSTVAGAYEADIHYSTTYVLARAVGWPPADALTIASANQGVDENHDTVAALEVEATSRSPFAGYTMTSFRQADKNLDFHCFSRTREKGMRISADVRQVIAHRYARVAAHSGTPQDNARRLIALGVALHCQQDAHSHVGFGGSCGSYSGSCHGHAYQTFLDHLFFRVLGKHFHNPDHPGVAGERLLETLEETVRALAAHRPAASARTIPAARLVALSGELRRSGLDLPDETRRDCNRYIAGKWLFDFLQSGSKATQSPDTLEKLSPGIARICRNSSLASATIVRIPAPRFPQLNGRGLPYLVRTDGNYRQVRAGEFAVSSPRIHTGNGGDSSPEDRSHTVLVQLSHWNHLLAFKARR